MWFSNKKNRQEAVAESEAQLEKIEEESSIEVIAIKSKLGEEAVKAERRAAKLNRLLRANGITLQIYIAKGGGHG